ncbi:hypothetical protein [Sporolituus thermophilus]|uniref:hypothetical protein n=1 Tax=Sporolituus thermophilus TaxID=608505 RepID=UPI000B83E0DC|nr:hypothetical protein [Sporolituus thermophilus]
MTAVALYLFKQTLQPCVQIVPVIKAILFAAVDAGSDVVGFVDDVGGVSFVGQATQVGGVVSGDAFEQQPPNVAIGEVAQAGR